MQYVNNYSKIKILREVVRMKMGYRIKDLRTSKGMTQEELGEIVVLKKEQNNFTKNKKRGYLYPL